MTNLKKDIKKVLLIFPHRISIKGFKEDLAPPLGIAYIAAFLEKAGYNVKILDVEAEDFYHREEVGGEYIQIGLSYEEIEKRIRTFSPDVVGVSCLLSTQFDSTYKICKLTKKINKNIVTIVGGEHPSSLPEESLQKNYIDFVIIGEGEYSTLSLLEAIKEGKGMSQIDGIGFKKGENIVIKPKTKFIENLDELPLPARHLLPMETYFKINMPQSSTSLKSPNTSIMTSRGCTANCIFCATTRFWGNKHRTRSIEKVLGEMEYLKKEYGIKELQFIDDNLTLNKEWAIKLFNGMIERKLNLLWTTPQGIALWSLDEELLKKMKESGCYDITLTIESGDSKVLNQIIRKPLKLEKIEPLVKAARKLGLIIKGYFIIGFPGETKEQMQKTLDFAKKLKLDAAGIFIATPLPGTDLYRICKEKDYLIEDFDFKKINYAKGNIQTPDFTPKEVEQMVSKSILSINLGLLIRNPIRFFKKYFVLSISNPKILLNYVRFLIKNMRNQQKQ